MVRKCTLLELSSYTFIDVLLVQNQAKYSTMNLKNHICQNIFSVFIVHSQYDLLITANQHSYLLDDGRLQKAININNKMHIIEEMVLFQDGQPVQRIELDTEKVINGPTEGGSHIGFALPAHNAS